MPTTHRIIFGNCRTMEEIPDEAVHLIVTSPPYFNAPFDYPGMFKEYDEFLELIEDLSRELYRVLAPGRVACFVADDMLVDGEKYPVVADITRAMIDGGFRYRDRITWVKPKGYVRISRRSGVLIQHPYPMYFYPDNIQESILIFQKGRFDYSYARGLPSESREKSRVDVEEYNRESWYLTVWNVTNVLPLGKRLEEGVAAFPLEIPRRLITLFSYLGETVLDPFLGSGTTTAAAKQLERNSWGYEVNVHLKPIIEKKLCVKSVGNGDRVEFARRKAWRRPRTRGARNPTKQPSLGFDSEGAPSVLSGIQSP